MELSPQERERFIDNLVGDSREVEDVVDETLYPILLDLAKDIVVKQGLERCEWCDSWDDTLTSTQDGQLLCEGCMDAWEDENEDT